MFKNHFTKYGQFIVRKIIKIVATRCQIFRLKCIKIDFGWSCAPDPARVPYNAPHCKAGPLVKIKGTYF